LTPRLLATQVTLTALISEPESIAFIFMKTAGAA